MKCPFCGNNDTQVKDSRATEDNSAIRRRRFCSACGARFTTFERIQLRELTVLKKSGKKVPFDRDKLERSVQIALRKRPVEIERIDRMISGIVRRVESLGETEISSDPNGKLAIEYRKFIRRVVRKNYRPLADLLNMHTNTLPLPDKATFLKDYKGASASVSVRKLFFIQLVNWVDEMESIIEEFEFIIGISISIISLKVFNFFPIFPPG